MCRDLYGSRMLQYPACASLSFGIPLYRWPFLACVSSPSDNCLLPTHTILVYPVEWDSLLSFWTSSVVPGYSTGIRFAANYPIFASLFSCSQFQSNPVGPEYRHSCSTSQLEHLCPDCGQLVLSVLPLAKPSRNRFASSVKKARKSF